MVKSSKIIMYLIFKMTQLLRGESPRLRTGALLLNPAGGLPSLVIIIIIINRFV